MTTPWLQAHCALWFLAGGMHGLIEEYGAPGSHGYLVALDGKAAGGATWHGSLQDVEECITGNANGALIRAGL